MGSCGFDIDFEFYKKLAQKRRAYKRKLISKGVIDGSNKMLTLMHRKGL